MFCSMLFGHRWVVIFNSSRSKRICCRQRFSFDMNGCSINLRSVLRSGCDDRFDDIWHLDKNPRVKSSYARGRCGFIGVRQGRSQCMGDRDDLRYRHKHWRSIGFCHFSRGVRACIIGRSNGRRLCREEGSVIPGVGIRHARCSGMWQCNMSMIVGGWSGIFDGGVRVGRTSMFNCVRGFFHDGRSMRTRLRRISNDCCDCLRIRRHSCGLPRCRRASVLSPCDACNLIHRAPSDRTCGDHWIGNCW